MSTLYFSNPVDPENENRIQLYIYSVGKKQTIHMT